MPPPDPAPLSLRFYAAIDRARNALALRVFNELQGDTGAIAAAMVTGKRDFFSENAKELIRRAGIFHIVTISGIQMSLVAGIFFVGLRRLFAFSRTLALNYPIKKWAAALAIIVAVVYDIGTGSRVGTNGSCHDAGDAGRGAVRPAGFFDAQSGLGGFLRRRLQAGGAARRKLPTFLRRRRSADRGL